MKNDGTELRITRISEDDTGDYICVAENTEGSVHSTTKVILAGEKLVSRILAGTHNRRNEINGLESSGFIFRFLGCFRFSQ